ncbi:manganese-binding transcriptional regulator MntR [Rhodobacteraceae bacterium]|nr:manganese-binding transcriptional regulator MntR [Paracoccaceae bacterium]
MPEEKLSPEKQAEGFSIAREKQAVALMEDYVELIAELTDELGEARVADIAERMGVAQPTATKAIARLKREGLATSRPYRGVFLTEKGAQMAKFVYERHRTLVGVLMKIGVSKEAAEIDAEGIEHFVSDETLAAFKKFLSDT